MARSSALGAAGMLWEKDTAFFFENNGQDGDSLESKQVHALSADPKFAEIDHKLLQSSDWRTSVHHVWHQKENIHVLEARSGLFAAERFCRSRFGQNSHKLFLGDNMGTTLALDRCRAHDFSLLVQ
eukprot:8844124-Karenia_brevis.AAC.1